MTLLNTAGYESGLCSGDANNKCCLNCNQQCINQDQLDQHKDGECDNIDGKCMDSSNYCNGNYLSGKCGGTNSRQCCAPNGSSGGGGSCGHYGCVQDLDTTGCSGTCNQDGACSGGGIKCSQQLASHDLNNLNKYKSNANLAGSSKHIDHSIIGAIISRESRAGAVLTTWNGEYGWGDCHNGQCYGFGLMQIDRRYHSPRGTWDSQEHMEQATDILIDTINCVGRNHPSWTMDMKTKGGISGYNAGCGNVQSYEGMDIGTTGNDYSSDCVARGQYFDNNGF